MVKCAEDTVKYKTEQLYARNGGKNSMSKTFQKLEYYLEKCKALNAALILFDWDGATEAPEKGDENTSKFIGVLSDLYFSNLINDEVKQLLSQLDQEKEQNELSDNEKAIVKEVKKSYEQLEAIPKEEYRAFSEMKAKATSIWEKAKEQGDYKAFEPMLEKLIDYSKKFVSYRKNDKKHKNSYDVLLGDFEPGFDVEQLDEFFQLIKDELVPFMKEILEKTKHIDKSYNNKKYDIGKQKELSRFLAEYIGFDFEKGVLADSAHPFTTNLHNNDVRITNHYYENNLESGIFSVIHESGHGVYEMQVGDDITMTIVGEGTSLGMHESQSRFFENVVGRSEEFWKPIYGKVQDTFKEQLKDVTLEQFIKGSNKPEAGLIRTEADELTYPIHVLIRYEIEKMIFNDEVEVKDLAKVWNKKYEEYLGVTPKDDKEGILQDIHWANADFGYFPSYAIGSAVAAQIYYHLLKVMPLNEYLEKGNIKGIREYLGEHIHRYGKMKNTNELLKQMTGEEFNPSYYIKYLKEKYTRLY